LPVLDKLIKREYYPIEATYYYRKRGFTMADLLSMKQVTARLGISERTVYRLMEEGELTPFKMGKSWRFEQSDVDAYIERLRQESAVKRGRPRGATEEKETSAA